MTTAPATIGTDIEGWRVTRNARDAIRHNSLNVQQVTDALLTPDEVNAGRQAGTEQRVKGLAGVVVNVADRVIITAYRVGGADWRSHYIDDAHVIRAAGGGRVYAVLLAASPEAVGRVIAELVAAGQARSLEAAEMSVPAAVRAVVQSEMLAIASRAADDAIADAVASYRTSTP